MTNYDSYLNEMEHLPENEEIFHLLANENRKKSEQQKY